MQVGGVAQLSLPIPANEALLSLLFNQQVVVLDPPANSIGLTMSNAKRGCLVPLIALIFVGVLRCAAIVTARWPVAVGLN